jgi:hypothetical protein
VPAADRNIRAVEIKSKGAELKELKTYFYKERQRGVSCRTAMRGEAYHAGVSDVGVRGNLNARYLTIDYEALGYEPLLPANEALLQVP